MKKVFSLFLMFLFVGILVGCDGLLDPANEAPIVTGTSVLVYDLGDEEPNWTSFVTAEDVEDGAIMITTDMVDATNVDFLTAGNYVVNIYVNDSEDKSTLFTINVEIVDNREYTFSLLGEDSVTIEVLSDYAEAGVLALDLDGAVADYTTSGTVNSNEVGVYSLSYTLAGVETPLNRTVNVVDTTAPVIEVDMVNLLFGAFTERNWLEYVKSVSDNYSEDITTVVLSSNVNFDEVGTYQVTIKATDEYDNEATASFSVVLQEIVIYVTGDSSVEHEVNSNYIDSGATALDSNLDQVTVNVENNVDESVLGTYTVNYTVEGYQGISLSRVVEVVDTTAPVLEIADQSITETDADVDWTTMLESATDNYDDTVLVTELEDNVEYGTPGEYTVILSATDSSGNTSNKTITVTVSEIYVNVLNTLPSEEINITFWHAYGQSKGELLNQQIEAFELLYPNINVTSVSRGDYSTLNSMTKLSIASESSPTMVLGYPDHFATYLAYEALVPLDDFANHGTWGIDLTDFIPSFIEENTQYVGGVMYSMPYSKYAEVLIYNKTVMDNLGISISATEALTYSELKNIATLAVGDGVNQCEYLANYDSASNLFINVTKQWNGAYTNSEAEILVDHVNTKAGLNYILSLFQDKTIVLPLAWSDYYGSEYFKHGEVCMTVSALPGVKYNMLYQGEVDSSSNPSSYIHGEFEVGFAPVPQLENGVSSVVQQGPNIGILSDSSDSERLAAWLLIKHLTNTENTTDWSMLTEYLPLRLSAINSVEYQEFLNYPTSDYINASKAANATLSQLDYFEFEAGFSTVVGITSSTVRQEAELALNDIYGGSKTVDEAIEEMLLQLGE